MNHKEIFSDGKEREECSVGHISGHSCIKCEHCGWVEYPYDSECKKIDFFDFIKEIAILRMQPGDILILKTPRDLSLNQIKCLEGYVNKIIFPFGPDKQLLILQEDLDISVLRKKTAQENHE